jgi:hypothetical protein
MKTVSYTLEINEDGLEIVKQLSQRWLMELEDAYRNIDEIFPLNMRGQVREDMGEQIKQAEHICEALGCQISSLS